MIEEEKEALKEGRNGRKEGRKGRRLVGFRTNLERM